jgi:(p)ppGpp synthase/HD superfamily hydrolase
MNLLEKAIILATKAHAGQQDKGEQPYILHPLAVMSRVASIDAKIVAVLHDVIEDSTVTVDDLQDEGFSDVIIQAVLAVTRQEHETYEAFIDRVSQYDLAVEVKLADLEENMNLDRIPNPSVKDKQRLARYQQAYYRLKRE